MHRVAGDRESRAGDVLLAQVRQRLLELAGATRGLAREIRCAAGPVCQTLRSQIQSNPIAASRSSSASGMSSSVAGRPSAARQLRQPDARVDLVERGVERIAHGWRATMRSPWGCGEPSGGRRRELGTVRAPFSRLGLLLDLHVDAFGGERELQALRGGDQANLHPVLIPP